MIRYSEEESAVEDGALLVTVGVAQLELGEGKPAVSITGTDLWDTNPESVIDMAWAEVLSVS